MIIVNTYIKAGDEDGGSPSPPDPAIAYLSSAGNDGTAELNNPSSPFATVEAAVTTLRVSHANDAVTVRLLDDVTADATLALSQCLGSSPPLSGLTFLGHGALRAFIGTITTSGGTSPGVPSPAEPATPGASGEDGGSITLDAVTLSAFVGHGGAGQDGGGFSGDVGNGGDGGPGGDGGNVTKLNGATVTSFASDGGVGGIGGAGGGSGGDQGATGATGTAGSEL